MVTGSVGAQPSAKVSAAHRSPVLPPNGCEARAMNRWSVSDRSNMKSPAGSSNGGQPVIVHGCVAVLVSHPAG